MSSDISDLLLSQPLPRSAVYADAGLMMKAVDQGAPQGAADNSMLVTAVAGSVVAVMLVVSMVIIGNAWRMRRRRRQQESDMVVIIQDMPGFMEANVS